MTAPGEAGPVLECRRYLAVAGREEDLVRRFREGTFALFADLGMEVLGFGQDREDPRRLEYVIRWASEEEMQRTWSAFAAGEGWSRLKEETERQGPLIERIERRLLHQIDHRPGSG